MRRILPLALLLLALAPALAVEPAEKLPDPALEARAREISHQLRCLVCQNQSIDDSNAELARDLRVLVRERLVAGDSDDAVIAHIHDRYGDFVLLRPPLRAGTLALWLLPFALVALGALALWRRSSRPAEAAAPLSPAEEAELSRRL